MTCIASDSQRTASRTQKRSHHPFPKCIAGSPYVKIVIHNSTFNIYSITVVATHCKIIPYVQKIVHTQATSQTEQYFLKKRSDADLENFDYFDHVKNSFKVSTCQTFTSEIGSTLKIFCTAHNILASRPSTPTLRRTR